MIDVDKKTAKELELHGVYLEELLKEECEKRGIELAFDINNLPGTKKALIYSKGYSGEKSLFVHPFNIGLSYRMYTQGLANTDIKHDFSKIYTGNADKYSLNKPKEMYDKILFLNGSNFLNKTMSIELVTKFMLKDSKIGKIKPHPFTMKSDIERLNQWFGEENVLEKSESGATLLYNAKEIAAPIQSELYSLAMLHNKDVSVSTNTPIELTGAYYCLNNFVNNGTELNTILNSKYSGAFTESIHTEQDLLDYLDAFETVFQAQYDYECNLEDKDKNVAILSKTNVMDFNPFYICRKQKEGFKDLIVYSTLTEDDRDYELSKNILELLSRMDVETREV